MENQVTYTSPESMGLPPGYRFFPNNKELLEYYLLKKINGESIPHNPIKDCDVYGEPMIWWDLFEKTGMKVLYFYTNNREKGKRVARNTVFGTWSGEGKIPIYDDDDEEERDDSNERERNHIGSRSTFSFAKREGFEREGSKHDTNWTMHEYKLDGIHKTKQNKDKYVLCKINKVIKKRGATKDKKRRAAKNNSRQNIQDEGAQPLDEDILKSSTFGNSDWIETYYGQ